MIGERIKQARVAAGLSLRDLAEKANVSAMAISKYERNVITPGSDVLLRMAQALGVRVEYFFRTDEVELAEIDFRKHAKLPSKDEERVLAEVREQVERWMALEAILPASWPKAFKLPSGLPTTIARYEEIEEVAEHVRKAWKLGQNPIRDLIEELEVEGIKVITTVFDGEKKFDGLVAMANKHPVIVVGAAWSGDRQRFTMAHELGHLVLRGRLDSKLDEEKACHRFAAAFLVPRQEALRALGETRTRLEPRELYLLKKEWGLSMNGWLHRAQDLNVINASAARSMWAFFRARGWRTQEPGDPYPQEQPRLFKQSIYRALGEDLIGESRAAELLGIGLSELRSRRRMDFDDSADRH